MSTELKKVKKRLQKIEKMSVRYLTKPTKDIHSQMELMDKFSEEYERDVGDFLTNLDDRYKILFKQKIEKIKEYDNMIINLLEDCENKAPFNIIHDEYYK